MAELLTRDEFRSRVLARRDGLCALCDEPATAAHHLIERALWPDGGYYLANGVALCDAHHWGAEDTSLSVSHLREAAGITEQLLPECLPPGPAYDKWGNVERTDGLRELGPLAGHDGMLKLLRRQGIVLI